MDQIVQLQRQVGLKWWPLSHRSKIVAWAFVPASLILGTVVLVAFFTYRQVTSEMVMERDRQLVQVAAIQLADQLEERVTPLGQVARVLAASDDLDGLQELPLGRSPADLASFDGGIVFVNQEGVVVTSEPRRPTLVGQDWSVQPFIRQVRERRQTVYSDLIMSATGPGGRPLHSIGIAMPVIGSNNDFRGAVVGFYSLNAPGTGPFSDSVLQLPLQGERKIYVVDGGGNVLYHADVAQIGANYGEASSVRMLAAGSDGALRTVDENGDAMVTAFAAVPGTEWGLVAEEAWASLVAPYAGYQNLLLFLLGLGLVAPAAIVLVGVRRLMRPLEALTVATQEVARGKFGSTIKVDSGDEIEILAHNFNHMSAQLATSYARLEERLTARTRELRALNAIAAVISHADELCAVLQVALDETLAVTGLEAGGVYILNESQQRLRLFAHKGLETTLVKVIDDLALGEGFSGEAAAQARPVLTSDLTNDARLTRKAVLESGFHGLGCFPISASGRVLGTLFILARERREFSSEDVELLTSISHQMGVAVENARLLEQVQISAAEEERQRLARELHDAVTQTLFSASLIAEVLPRLWEKDEALARLRLGELRELSRGALAEMRALLLELRPAVLEASPLPDLLRQLVEATRGRAQLNIALTVDGVPPSGGLPGDVQVGLYRIAQEALNNIVKHAEATKVDVQIAFGAAGVLLDIHDDGKGIDDGVLHGSRRVDSFGLSIMYERAERIGADLQIESDMDRGTTITVFAPSPES
ncbi:MAG: GAF domain-containing protein [Chloroflexota bacterium]